MPVMPGYAHADEAHEKTVAGAEYRYGCHSRKIGDSQRGRTVDRHSVQDGWTSDGRRRMVELVSDWIEMACGHTTRATDPACEGCSNGTR